MTPPRSLEDRLAELHTAGGDVSRERVRRALSDRAALVVTRAARLATAPDLAPDLEDAFLRLLHAPAKADPGCLAKRAIVEALRGMADEVSASETCATVYLPGVRHVQMEPVRGGRVDTAGDLRAACAFSLVREDHPRALLVLADLLADPLHTVRAEAARALAWRGRADGIPLLRLRWRVGDGEAEAEGAYLAALLVLDVEAALSLAKAALGDARDDDHFQAAALAIGESHADGALHVLRESWDHEVTIPRRKVLAMAVSLLRRDEAFEFLLARIGDGSPDTAVAVLEALSAFGGDACLRDRVEAAVQDRDDLAVSRRFEEVF